MVVKETDNCNTHSKHSCSSLPLLKISLARVRQDKFPARLLFLLTSRSYLSHIINALFEVRKVFEEENEFIQRKLTLYLEKTNPDELLLNATIKYPQFKDESKKIKLYLIDVVNDNEMIMNTSGN